MLRTVDIERLLHLCQRDLTFDLIRGSGPGGQNVNKVATAVQLRFDVRRSLWLGEEAKDRLVRLAGRRMTSSGVLVIEARRRRSQSQNKEDALARFAALVRKAFKEARDSYEDTTEHGV